MSLKYKINLKKFYEEGIRSACQVLFGCLLTHYLNKLLGICSLFRKDLLIYVIHCRDHKEMKQPTETTLET